MDNFYDINDFIVFLFKKWKTIIAFVILGAVFFAGNRTVSMAGKYLSQSDETQEKADASHSDNEEPMWIKVQNVIEIMPGENDATNEEMETILDGYRKLSASASVLDAISNEWYESEKKENQNRVKEFHDYGYILDKEVNYPYALRDFYTQFLVNNNDLNTTVRTQYTYNEKYVAVGFKSTDRELAEKIADDYTEKLTEAVQKSLGDFSYRIVDQSVLYDLPAASGGTQTTRVVSSSSASSSVITVNQIVKQGIKGVIWGALIGGVISIIAVFLMYMMTKKMYLLSDARKYNVPVIGTGFWNEKYFVKLRARFHRALEGGNWDESGHRTIVRRIAELADEQYSGKKIYLTGTCGLQYMKKIVQELNSVSSHTEFCCVEGIHMSAQTVKIVKKEDTAFILVERFGESVKDNIGYEIEELNKLETEIIGMLVLE